MNPDKYLEDIYKEEQGVKFNDWKENIIKPVNDRPKGWNEYEWLLNFIIDSNYGYYKDKFIMMIYKDQVEQFMKYYEWYAQQYTPNDFINNNSNVIVCGSRIYFSFDDTEKIEQLDYLKPKEKCTIKKFSGYDEFIYEGV